MASHSLATIQRNCSSERLLKKHAALGEQKLNGVSFCGALFKMVNFQQTKCLLARAPHPQHQIYTHSHSRRSATKGASGFSALLFFSIKENVSGGTNSKKKILPESSGFDLFVRCATASLFCKWSNFVVEKEAVAFILLCCAPQLSRRRAIDFCPIKQRV